MLFTFDEVDLPLLQLFSHSLYFVTIPVTPTKSASDTQLSVYSL